MGSFDRVADTYQESRHGYPTELRDHLIQIEALKTDSVVVDLGAGTGQLAMMASEVATEVVAIDPEPDMVRVGKRVTGGAPAVRWLLGSDSDVCQLVDPPVDLVLIGNAFHHMAQATLLTNLDALVATRGAVVVCSTSIPVWLQDTAWSATLRRELSRELGRPVSENGTPDHGADMIVLGGSPFSAVGQWVSEREHQRNVESIIGEVVSSASGALGTEAAERLRSALAPHAAHGAVTENVKTTALIARRRAG